VAISRCRTLEGTYLFGINFAGFRCHPKVKEYYKRFSFRCTWAESPKCCAWREVSRESEWGGVESCSDCFPTFLHKKGFNDDMIQMIKNGLQK
jgi:hypothetical protein